jgi:hypothetical protein
MAIDTDLILRQASDVQKLRLTASRASEIARETQEMLDSAFAASEDTAFEDAPSQFLAMLVELRDR